MITRPNRDEQAHLEFCREVLLHRSDRFARLVRLNAPHTVLAGDAVLLLKAVAMIAPKEIGAALGELLLHSARIGLGRCSCCGDPMPHVFERFCQSCEDEITAEVESDDRDIEEP
jgi:hypothetical protein